MGLDCGMWSRGVGRVESGDCRALIRVVTKCRVAGSPALCVCGSIAIDPYAMTGS